MDAKHELDRVDDTPTDGGHDIDHGLDAFAKTVDQTIKNIRGKALESRGQTINETIEVPNEVLQRFDDVVPIEIIEHRPNIVHDLRQRLGRGELQQLLEISADGRREVLERLPSGLQGRR